MDGKHVQLVQMHLHVGQTAQARVLLTAALTEDPTDAVAHLLMAHASIDDDIDVAEMHAQYAAADATTARAASILLSSMLLNQHRVPEAVELASTAVHLDPENWKARSALALALLQVPDIPAAIGQADAAVRLAPANPDERARALVTLGRVFLADPANVQRGYAVMRDAAALDPTNPALQQQVMLAQFRSGRKAEAVATALSSLRITPTAATPPYLARLSVFLLSSRALGWMLIVAFVTPLIFVGVAYGALGADDAAGHITIRAGAAFALAMDGLVLWRVFRALRDPAVARAVWRFAKRSALAWFAGVLITLVLLSYLAALIFGYFFFVGLPLPFLLLLPGWIIHSWGSFAVMRNAPA